MQTEGEGEEPKPYMRILDEGLVFEGEDPFGLPTLLLSRTERGRLARKDKGKRLLDDEEGEAEGEVGVDGGKRGASGPRVRYLWSWCLKQFRPVRFLGLVEVQVKNK